MQEHPETDPAAHPYPPKLLAILNLFEHLPDEEKRENLIAYSDSAARCAPRPDETFTLQDIRKDEECADTVGVFLSIDPETHATRIRLSLGPQVQTLTRAMAAILSKGLDGATPAEILALPADFVPRIVGAQLVRVRSQTVYYILTRIKSACKVHLDRLRAQQ